MATKMPNIGQLDRRIEIQEPVETRTQSGSVSTTWNRVARCWAMVSYASTGNKEDVLGDMPVATTRQQFTIRYRDGLTEKMRIVYQGQYYNMLPPFEEVGRRAFLTIPAEKQV